MSPLNTLLAKYSNLFLESVIFSNNRPWFLTFSITVCCHVGDKATNRHEPLLMTIDYGKGRTFHSTLGHMDYSMECVGFITTFQRGAEWAATGKVTQDIPKDFPTENSISY